MKTIDSTQLASVMGGFVDPTYDDYACPIARFHESIAKKLPSEKAYAASWRKKCDAQEANEAAMFTGMPQP